MMNTPRIAIILIPSNNISKIMILLLQHFKSLSNKQNLAKTKMANPFQSPAKAILYPTSLKNI